MTFEQDLERYIPIALIKVNGFYRFSVTDLDNIIEIRNKHCLNKEKVKDAISYLQLATLRLNEYGAQTDNKIKFLKRKSIKEGNDTDTLVYHYLEYLRKDLGL